MQNQRLINEEEMLKDKKIIITIGTLITIISLVVGLTIKSTTISNNVNRNQIDIMEVKIKLEAEEKQNEIIKISLAKIETQLASIQTMLKGHNGN